jgi:hypothetical protein
MLQSDMDGRMNKQRDEFERQRAEFDRYKTDTEKRIAQMQKIPAVAPAAAAAELESAADDITGVATAAGTKVRKSAASVKDAANPAVAAAGKKPAAPKTDPSVREGLANVRASLDPDGDAVADAAPDAGAAVADANDANDAKLLRDEQDLLNSSGVGTERVALENGQVTGAFEDETRLSKEQALILAQPAIARVKVADPQGTDGFVVLDRGRLANLEPGDSFAVRRGSAIIGRVTIGQTIEANECIAEVDLRGRVAGIVIQKGDHIIKYER